jgi:hypothetical protein
MSPPTKGKNVMTKAVTVCVFGAALTFGALAQRGLDVERDAGLHLAGAKTVYVDPGLSSDVDFSKLVREKLVFAIMKYTKFSVTENAETADLLLTGVAKTEQLQRFGAVGTIAAGGVYRNDTLVLRLIDRSSKATVWVFDSDAAKCRVNEGRAVCAGADLGKTVEAAVKRVKSAR